MLGWWDSSWYWYFLAFSFHSSDVWPGGERAKRLAPLWITALNRQFRESLEQNTARTSVSLSYTFSFPSFITRVSPSPANASHLAPLGHWPAQVLWTQPHTRGKSQCDFQTWRRGAWGGDSVRPLWSQRHVLSFCRNKRSPHLVVPDSALRSELFSCFLRTWPPSSFAFATNGMCVILCVTHSIAALEIYYVVWLA